jgi:hypothetical protein
MKKQPVQHLTKPCWLRLLIGRDDLAALRAQHPSNLTEVLDGMYCEHCRTTEKAIEQAHNGSLPPPYFLDQTIEYPHD